MKVYKDEVPIPTDFYFELISTTCPTENNDPRAATDAGGEIRVTCEVLPRQQCTTDTEPDSKNRSDDTAGNNAVINLQVGRNDQVFQQYI